MSFKPTAHQRAIANAFSRSAQLLGSRHTVRRLHDETGARFDQPRVGQLIAHVAMRQAEYGRGVVDEFRAGRFSAASALGRSLLEMTAWIAWPFSVSDHNLQRSRLIQLLLEGWRDGKNRGTKLPSDAVALLKSTTGKGERKPPSFPDMLKALDKIERETEGGTEFWVSHAASFDAGSQYVHPSLYGTRTGLEALDVDELLGVEALVFGHQYLSLSAVTCAIAAELDDLKLKVETRFGAVHHLQRKELDRLRA